MLTSQRKSEILALLKRQGQVEAKALATHYAVSEDTIRRDLREMAAEGLLQRVHGGALLASPAEAGLAERQRIAIPSKAQVAAAATRLIAPGQIVILDGGTTCAELARSLPRDMPLTVVTHSPTIAVALAEHEKIEVVLIGGRLFRHSMVAVGAAALEALSHVRADLYFMGVTGVHAEAGFSTGDYEEAYIKRALSARAAETVVLASNEKLGVASAYKIGDLGMAASLVVDGAPSPELGAALASAGVSVVSQ
ncbi:DeoR/GlpR family DNA-binding transcription regulator [Massilia sp. IC2-477]|uniref:DeoR/GlpR family DNA-binding transcription regulator n=1 Tax=Massilia sp. IC2-477 TaxID=2887198 RepID=UPI001D12538C|nr:DeoR/GlpR family DNA-binding transcription regulator [Massilia sp. IC2-477]MCC2954684.1 DeoR/GlpR family DNA-binding transcription regulator [Massilia sp. IC2-477]